MPLTEDQIERLRAAGREDIIEHMEVKEAGYAGMLPNGNLVDRRQFPDAIPLQKNTLLGIPEPKPLL